MEEIVKINEIILFEKLMVAWIFGAVIVLLVICSFLVFLIEAYNKINEANK